MNPDVQYQFIHAVASVARLVEVEKAVLGVVSPTTLLMVTPRSDGDFSIIVGVPQDEEKAAVLAVLEQLAGQTTVIGGKDTPNVGKYLEGSSEPTLDF